MQRISEPLRMPSAMGQTDALVIGGGPAGFGAAVAASRQGLKVCLLEFANSIGGIMATCPGMPIGGILNEFLQRLYAMDPPAAEKRKCRLPADAFRLTRLHSPRFAVWQPAWA